MTQVKAYRPSDIAKAEEEQAESQARGELDDAARRAIHELHRAGWSLRELAKLHGISFAAVCRVLRERPPSLRSRSRQP